MANCTLHEKLPRELRDLIYEEALAVEEVTIDGDHDRGAYIPGLLQTCKQIRAEASKPFYSETHFRIITPRNAMFTPIEWLDSIPARYRKQLRKITVLFKAGHHHPDRGITQDQELYKYEIHNRMVSESRYLSDKRRVETFELLEQLSAVQHLRRKIIAFEVAATPGAWAASYHDWLHELRSRLLESPKQFANDRAVAMSCRVCVRREEHQVLLNSQWTRLSRRQSIGGSSIRQNKTRSADASGSKFKLVALRANSVDH